MTLAIGTNPSTGVLSGTLTQTAVNGIATFNNLAIDVVANGYTLAATSNPVDTTATAAVRTSSGRGSRAAAHSTAAESPPPAWMR